MTGRARVAAGRRRLLLLGIVLAVVATACGGSSGNDATVASTSGSVEAVATTAAPTTAAPTTAAPTTAAPTTAAPTTAAPTTAAPTSAGSTVNASTTSLAVATTTEGVITETADGVLYTLARHSVSVHFPGRPDERPLAVKLPDGSTIDATVASYQEGEEAVVLTAAVLPAARLASATPAQILADSQAGSLAQTKGTLVSEQEIVVAGNPAREFVAKVVQGAQTGRVRTRVLVVGDRQIQLVYAASEAAYVEADAEGFFSSLVLTGN